MLKLRNAVLTALLAFCLAMPFVSCSFNDGATGDVSNLVKEQPGNNQNGGNGGSTGGNEKPSGGDEDSGDNGNENSSGGNNGGSEKPTDPTEPGAGTTYVVIYNGTIIEESLPESKWFYGVKKVNLKEGVDYTMKGNEITLKDSGYEKVLPLLGDSGDDGEHGGIPPVTDEPVTDEPGTEYPGTDEPDYGDEIVYTIMYSGDEITTIPESGLSFYVDTFGLVAGTDYTISGNVITLTDSGFKKGKDAGFGK